MMAAAVERGWPLLVTSALIAAYGWAAWRRFRLSGAWPADWTEPVRHWLETPAVWTRLQPMLERPQSALVFLEGDCGKERLARWIAEGAGIAGILLAAGGFMAWLAGEPGLLLLFAVLAVATPFLRWKDLRNKADSRRRQMRRELPELLTRLVIVVNAGENVLRALERCAARGKPGGRPEGDRPVPGVGPTPGTPAGAVRKPVFCQAKLPKKIVCFYPSSSWVFFTVVSSAHASSYSFRLRIREGLHGARGGQSSRRPSGHR